MASASVIKRRSSWYVRVTARRGEKESWIRAGATKREAEKLRAQILTELADGVPRGDPPRTPRFEPDPPRPPLRDDVDEICGWSCRSRNEIGRAHV